MQMSGTCPPFSDGTKKTVSVPVVTIAPKAIPPPMAPPVPAKANGHRAGGFHKQQRKK